MFAVIAFLLAMALGAAADMRGDGSAAGTVLLVAYVLFIASLVMTVYSGCEYVLKNKDIFSM